MVQKEVVVYIQSLLKQGYSEQAIRYNLLQRGFTADSISEHFNLARREVNPLDHAPEHHFILIGLIVVVLLGILSLFWFSFFQPTQSTPIIVEGISADLSLSSNSIQQGQPLVFDRLILLKNSKEAKVHTLLEVKDTRGKVVATQEDDIHVQEEDYQSITLSLPNLPAGKYLIRMEARLGEAQSVANKEFTVLNLASIEPNCFDAIKNQDEEEIDCGGVCDSCVKECPLSCDDRKTCTQDYCNSNTNFKCVHEDVFPCCGDDICESSESKEICEQDCSPRGSPLPDPQQDYVDPFPYTLSLNEKIEEVKILAKSSPQQALAFCDHISLESSRDQCYSSLGESLGRTEICNKVIEERMRDICISRVARKLNESILCDGVIDENKRDSCYMGFAKNKDFSVCPKISSEYLRQFCYQLERVIDEKPSSIL